MKLLYGTVQYRMSTVRVGSITYGVLFSTQYANNSEELLYLKFYIRSWFILSKSQNSSSFSAKSNRITNNNNTTRNSLKKLHLQQKHLDLFERASLHSTKSNNLLKKNEITKSSKSLTRSIVSRSNSKDSAAVATANNQRSRTCSQTNTSTIINNQSPSNFRKVVQIFTTSQMMGKLNCFFFYTYYYKSVHFVKIERDIYNFDNCFT